MARLYIGMLVCLCFSFQLNAQDDPCRYISSKPKAEPIVKIDTAKYSKNFRQEFSTALSRNPSLYNQPAFYLLSLASTLNVKLERECKGKNASFTVFDEIGWLFISDSFSLKNRDLTRIKLEHSGGNTSKSTSASVALIAESQKVPSYRKPTTIPETKEPIVESAFMSPGIFIVSAGFTFKQAETYKLDFGLGACKLTWIARKDIFALAQSAKLNAETQHKRLRAEGGLSFQAAVDKNLGHHLNWQNNTLLFADLSRFKIPDLELRNNLSWSPTKILKTSLQTVVIYNKDRFPSCSWKGEFVIGVLLERVN